ncbi:MAG: L-threonylcarbamoyladenylate synthase [Caldilineales bacterium]
MTERLDAASPAALARAVHLLQQGELVAFPTDTVYGVGTLVWDAAAVARIYEAKQRPEEKAIPVLLADLTQAGALGVALSSALVDLAARFWPGPLTLVAACGPQVPANVTAGTQTVALRVPAHPAALRLFAALGQPLAVTSANLSGHANPLTAEDVLAQLGGRIAAVLDGGMCPGGVPSTVLNLAVTPVRLERRGPISAAQLYPWLSAEETPHE